MPVRHAADRFARNEVTGRIEIGEAGTGIGDIQIERPRRYDPDRIR